MWARLKLYFAAVVIGVAAAWQIVVMIRRSERHSIEHERVGRRIEAMKEAGRIRDDVESDPHLATRARDWVRDDTKR